MNVEIKTYGKELTPSDPANVLCDGSSYGRKIITPLYSDESVWQEMTEATAEAAETVTETEKEAVKASGDAVLVHKMIGGHGVHIALVHNGSVIDRVPFLGGILHAEH